MNETEEEAKKKMRLKLWIWIQIWINKDMNFNCAIFCFANVVKKKPHSQSHRQRKSNW